MSAPAPTWLIAGAGSAVARAFSRAAAAEDVSLLLAGRDLDDLHRQAADLAIRYRGRVAVLPFDANAADTHARFAADVAVRAGGVLNLFLAIGIMPEQDVVDHDPQAMAAMVAANFTGAATLLAALAPVLEARRQGIVIALGSVAGDRGRRRHYAYGATKAALATYLQGYAARMERAGVRVLTVKPGPVDSSMTWGHARLPFLAQPEAVAAAILRRARGRGGTFYVPRLWAPIMLAIRLLPTRLFHRLDL